MTLVIEVMIRISFSFGIRYLDINYHINVHVGTGTTGGDRGRDRDRDPANPRRNDGGPEAGSVRGTGIRDDIESGGVVREIGTEKGATEESVPKGTGIARENGIPSKKSFSTLI